MFNPTAQQSIKATADGGVYTVGGAGAFGFIPGTWGEWAAAVAVVYGLLQIGVLVYPMITGKPAKTLFQRKGD